MANEETRRNIRAGAIELLDLYASRDDLLRLSPKHYPVAELFEMWDDIHLDTPDALHDIFSSSEVEALRRFNTVSERTWTAVRTRSERIADFVASAEWLEFAAAARAARAELGA
jgi:hypothetical protein